MRFNHESITIFSQLDDVCFVFSQKFDIFKSHLFKIEFDLEIKYRLSVSRYHLLKTCEFILWFLFKMIDKQFIL